MLAAIRNLHSRGRITSPLGTGASDAGCTESQILMPDPKNQPPLLELRGFKRHFPVDDGFFFGSSRTVKAVDGVDLTITKGESLGLVGESGCGKSTVGRNIVRLDTPTAGEIRFDGVDIAGFDTNQLKPYRQQIQIIFQNPFSSLNPRKTAGNMLSEPLLLHKIGDRKERRDRVIELLSHVGLGSEHYDRYPHEFSGGQRQRLGIARALALQPKLVVCDRFRRSTFRSSLRFSTFFADFRKNSGFHTCSSLTILVWSNICVTVLQ